MGMGVSVAAAVEREEDMPLIVAQLNLMLAAFGDYPQKGDRPWDHYVHRSPGLRPPPEYEPPPGGFFRNAHGV